MRIDPSLQPDVSAPASARSGVVPPVVMILPGGLELGGVTSWALQLVDRLAERGCEMMFLEHTGPGGAERVPEGLRRHPVEGHTRGSTEADLHGFLPAYRAALPGLLVPNYSEGTYATCALLAQTHAEALRLLGYAHADSPYYYRLLEHYEPIIHAFVAVSERIAARLCERLPHRAADVHVRPYGVAVPPEARHAYSRPGEPLRLLYAGRLNEEQKRITDLARLVRELGALRIPFELTIAGEGEDAWRLERRLRWMSPRLRARVRCLGRVPHHEMEALWRASDVSVLVSAYEGVSIAMLEAMAHGCVPVVTAVSGTETMIRNGENGFALPVGDVAGMARVLADLADERGRLGRLGCAARTAVAALCSPTAYADWFSALRVQLWAAAPRRWPEGRPLLPPRPAVSRPVIQPLLSAASRALSVAPGVHLALRRSYLDLRNR